MSVATATVGWGIAGCGWVARDFVAPALQALAPTRAVALLDPDPAALEAVAAGAPDAQRHRDLDAFLAAPGLDAVYVAAPNHLHRPLTEAAARAGKHVLCEKPMARTRAEAEAMVAACAQAGVRYATAFDQRFHAAHRALRALVADGTLGTVTAVRIAYTCWVDPRWAPDNWRVDPDRAGGGALIDLAPHGLDLVATLLGEPLDDVVAARQHRVHPYAVEDGAMLVGATRSGVLASLHVAYNTPEAFPRRRLEVVGTRAMAVATNTMGQTPGGTLALIDATTGVARPVALPDQRSPFEVGVQAFTDALLRDEPFAFDPEGDLHTMRLLESAGR